MPPKKKAVVKNGNGANLGFEQTLWATRRQMRVHMDASEYKHALGLENADSSFDAFGREAVRSGSG